MNQLQGSPKKQLRVHLRQKSCLNSPSSPTALCIRYLTCLHSPISSYVPISSPNKEISFLKSETTLSTSHILSEAPETSQNLEGSSNAYWWIFHPNYNAWLFKIWQPLSLLTFHLQFCFGAPLFFLFQYPNSALFRGIIISSESAFSTEPCAS